MDAKDRDILRLLAKELVAVSQQPVQQERIDGWRRCNMLRPQRPMLWITEIPWGEIQDKHEALVLQCEDGFARNIEAGLRRRLFTQKYLPVDEVEDGIFRVGKVIRGAMHDYGVNIEEETIGQGQSSIVAHSYKAAIKDEADIERIKMPDIRYDEPATIAEVEKYTAVFGDSMPVRAVGPQQNFFAGWDILVRWTGVESALMDLYERPEFIHAIMRRMTDSFLLRMTQLEALQLLDAPHPQLRVGSGAAGFTDELPQADTPSGGPYTCMDHWGGATAQIFSEVSPAMHAEFALAYETEIMQRCGLNYYGCCEPLHNKMDLMNKIPRLRKISVSPWCNVALTAERADKKYVFSHKPSPAMLATEQFNAAAAEADLRRRLDESAGMPCEIIMKDISTIKGDVQRLIDWCAMAARVVRIL